MKEVRFRGGNHLIMFPYGTRVILQLHLIGLWVAHPTIYHNELYFMDNKCTRRFRHDMPGSAVISVAHLPVL